MKSLKSPISRIGGKYFLTGWLNGYIPEHTLYCEVFSGAAHLLFSKTPSPVEVVNDIDNHLINFFQVIKDNEKRERLKEILSNTPYSRMVWQMMRDNWKRGDLPIDDVERTVWWFYLNRICFGGDQERGGFAIPSVTGRNPIQSFRNSIKTFEDVADRLRNVCVENLNYAECIRRYDSPDTLFYCDPPYLDAEDYYGKGNFVLEDHHRLSELLHGIKGKAMVSHYQNGLYDDLYKGWERDEYSGFKGSYKAEAGQEKPKTVEVLYFNFKPVSRNRSLFG